MITFRPLLFCISTALAVAGCANAPNASNKVNSAADARLRSDVMQMIGIYEAAAGGSKTAAASIGK